MAEEKLTEGQTTNSLLTAMDMIAKSRINGLQFDKTELAEIVDITDRNNGDYVVFNGSARYHAYTENTSYTLGTKVYVSIPNNDMSGQKTIVRKYIDKNYNRALNYILPLDQYTPGTSNILEGLSEQYQLLANWNKVENQIGEQSIIVFESGDLSDSNIQGFKYMGLSADFQTLMGGQKITKGNYGLKVYVRYEYQINEEPAEQIICYALDTSNMVGSLYNFFTGFEQQALFELPDYMAGRVIRQIVVEFFQDGDFENTSGTINVQPDDMGLLPPDNIIVKNISLQFGDAPIETTEVDKITISAINGLFYDSAYGDNDLNTRNIRLKWYHRNPSTADENHQYGTLELMDKVKKIPNELGLTFNAFIWWLHDSQRTWDEVIENQKTFTERLENLKELQNVYLNEINPDAGLDGYGNPIKFENDDEFSNYWFICDETGHNEHFHQLIDSFSLKEERDYIYNNITNYFELKQSGISKIKRKIILTPIGDTHECEWGYGWNLINEDTEYDEFNIDFYPDIKAQNCKVKCVIEYGPLNEDGTLNRESQHYTVVESNILEFNNKSIVPDSLTWDAAIGLTVQFNDKSNGTYPLYNGSDGRISNINDATKDRVLEADIKSSYNGRSYLNGNETLIWKIPKYNTMIEISRDSMDIMNGQLLLEDDDIITKTIFETYSGVIGEYDNNYWYLMYSSNYGDKDNLYQRYQYEFQKRIDEYLERLKKIDSFIEFTEEDVQNYTEATNTPEKAQKYIENIRGLIDKRDAQSDIRTIYNKLRYRIEQYMRPERTNNTITCYLIKNSVMIKSDVTMQFTQHGTAGTDYTFTLGLGKLYNIDEDENGKQVWTEIGGTDSALTIGEDGWREIVFNLYNAKNEIIDIPLELRSDIIYKWKASDENGFLWGQDLIHGTPQKISYKINDDNTRIALKAEDSDINRYQGGLVLKATLTSGTISASYGEKSYNLQGINFTQILPIPIRSGEEKYTVEGVDFITYNDNGGSPSYYKDALVLEQNGEAIDGANFKLWYQNKEKINGNTFLQWEKVSETIFDENNNRIIKYNTINSGFPSINEVKLNDGQVVYKLVPYPIYFTGIENTPLFLGYYEGEILRYIAPIVILQNQYQVPMLNSWDGNLLVDSDNNRVMAATMAAGHKNDDNTFTGVIMGDVEHQVGDSKKTITGLYGYHEGAQSFGFKEDGTAFIGKSGAGRLYVNGDEGAIESGNYASTEGADGTKIDLKDGSIDMNNSAYHTNIHLDTNGSANKPYFRIDVPKIPIERDNNNEIIKQSLMQIDNTNYYLQTADYDGSSRGLQIDLKNGTFDSKGRLTINGATGSKILFGDSINHVELGNDVTNGGSYFDMISAGGTVNQIRDAGNLLREYADDLNYFLWHSQLIEDENSYYWDTTDKLAAQTEFASPENITIYGGKSGKVWVVFPKNNNTNNTIIDLEKFKSALEKKLSDKNPSSDYIGLKPDEGKQANDYLEEGCSVYQIKIEKKENGLEFSKDNTILNPNNYIFYEQQQEELIGKIKDANGNEILDEETQQPLTEIAYKINFVQKSQSDIAGYFSDKDIGEVLYLYIKRYEEWKEYIPKYEKYVTYDSDKKVFLDINNGQHVYISNIDRNKTSPLDENNNWSISTQNLLITKDSEKLLFDSYITNFTAKSNGDAYREALAEYDEANDVYENALAEFNAAAEKEKTAKKAKDTATKNLDDTASDLQVSLKNYNDNIISNDRLNFIKDTDDNSTPYLNYYLNSENMNLNYIELLKVQKDAESVVSAKTSIVETKKKIFTGSVNSWNYTPKSSLSTLEKKKQQGFCQTKGLKNTADNYLKLYNAYVELLQDRETLKQEKINIKDHFYKYDDFSGEEEHIDLDYDLDEIESRDEGNRFITDYTVTKDDQLQSFYELFVKNILDENDQLQSNELYKDVVNTGVNYKLYSSMELYKEIRSNNNDDTTYKIDNQWYAIQTETYNSENKKSILEILEKYDTDINFWQTEITKENGYQSTLTAAEPDFHNIWDNYYLYGTEDLTNEYTVMAEAMGEFDFSASDFKTVIFNTLKNSIEAYKTALNNLTNIPVKYDDYSYDIISFLEAYSIPYIGEQISNNPLDKEDFSWNEAQGAIDTYNGTVNNYNKAIAIISLLFDYDYLPDTIGFDEDDVTPSLDNNNKATIGTALESLRNRQRAYQQYDDAYKNLKNVENIIAWYENKKQEFSELEDEITFIYNNEYTIKTQQNILLEDYNLLQRLIAIPTELNELNSKTLQFEKSETSSGKERSVVIVDFAEPFTKEYTINNKKKPVDYFYDLYNKYNDWQDAIAEQTEAKNIADKISEAVNDMLTQKTDLENKIFIQLTSSAAASNFTTLRNYQRLYIGTTKQDDSYGVSFNYCELVPLDATRKSKKTYYKRKNRDDLTDLLVEENKAIVALEQATSDLKNKEVIKNAAEINKNNKEKILKKFDQGFVPFLYTDESVIKENTQYYKLINGEYQIIQELTDSFKETIIYEKIDIKQQLLDIIQNKLYDSIISIREKYSKLIDEYIIAYQNFMQFNQGNVDGTIKLSNTDNPRLVIGSHFSVDKIGHFKASSGEMENITVKTLNFKGYTDENGSHPSVTKIAPKLATLVTAIDLDGTEEYLPVTAKIHNSVTVEYEYNDTVTYTKTIATPVTVEGTFNFAGKNPTVSNTENCSITFDQGADDGAGLGYRYCHGHVKANGMHTVSYDYNAKIPVKAKIDVPYEDTWEGSTDVPAITSVRIKYRTISAYVFSNNAESNWSYSERTLSTNNA